MQTNIMRRLELIDLGVVLLAGLVAALAPSAMTWSIFAGAAIFGVNLIVLAWLMRPLMMGRASKGKKALCLVILPIKTLALGLALLALFHYGGLRLGGFALGGLAVLAITTVSALLAWRRYSMQPL